MKVIYEPGDIVYNANNHNYAIVLNECLETPRILEVDEKVFVNSPPKAALTYIGHTDIKRAIKSIIEPFAEARE